MKNTIKIGALIFAAATALLGPSAQAVTQVGGYPCYGTVSIYVDGQPTNPCDTANNSVVKDAWKDASIVGWNGPTGETDSVGSDVNQRIASLEQQNATLSAEVSSLSQRLAKLENQQPVTSSPVIQTVTQSGDYESRIAAIEKEQKVVSGYMYLLEQRIGELYAKMYELFAPVYKVLNLK